MVSARPELEEDTLFIACTRPAMIAGVTMEAMGINVIVVQCKRCGGPFRASEVYFRDLEHVATDL